MRKPLVKVKKSPEAKKARTAYNKEVRAARLAREMAKSAITFPARGRYYRRHHASS